MVQSSTEIESTTNEAEPKNCIVMGEYRLHKTLKILTFFVKVKNIGRATAYRTARATVWSVSAAREGKLPVHPISAFLRGMKLTIITNRGHRGSPTMFFK